MKPLFSKRPLLQVRLLLLLTAAMALIVADSQWERFTQWRSYLDSTISPLYTLANAPWLLLDTVSQHLTTLYQLQLEKRALHQELLLKNSDLLLLMQLKQENDHLRALLDSPRRHHERKSIAHILAIDPNIYRHQVIIDKGQQQGVYLGQPIINDKGVVGQVVAVSQTNSRVLLICDATHAIPLQVLRNDIRMIAYGTGDRNELQLELMPLTVDIRPNDLLVTSGLGERFPEGYPVATVTSIVVDQQRGYSVIKARPTAALERLHYLLLLWPQQHYQATALPAALPSTPSKTTP